MTSYIIHYQGSSMSANGTQAKFGKEREADGRVNSFLDKSALEYLVSNACLTHCFGMAFCVVCQKHDN